MDFERELETYDQHVMELLPHNEGRYVAILDQDLIGPFETYEKSLQAGYEKFGDVEFLVKRIHRPNAEPIHYFSRDMPRCSSLKA